MVWVPRAFFPSGVPEKPRKRKSLKTKTRPFAVFPRLFWLRVVWDPKRPEMRSKTLRSLGSTTSMEGGLVSGY